MAPFVELAGACHGERSKYEWVDGAARGMCQRRCWATIEASAADAATLVGRCVAYSISTAPHEDGMCTMWDALSLSGSATDGHPDRRCSRVEASQVRDGVVPPPEASRMAEYRARIASRSHHQMHVAQQ